MLRLMADEGDLRMGILSLYIFDGPDPGESGYDELALPLV